MLHLYHGLLEVEVVVEECSSHCSYSGISQWFRLTEQPPSWTSPVTEAEGKKPRKHLTQKIKCSGPLALKWGMSFLLTTHCPKLIIWFHQTTREPGNIILQWVQTGRGARIICRKIIPMTTIPVFNHFIFSLSKLFSVCADVCAGGCFIHTHTHNLSFSSMLNFIFQFFFILLKLLIW